MLESGGSDTRIVRFLMTGDAHGALRAQEEVGRGFEKTGDSADQSAKHLGIFHKSLEGIKNVIGYGSGVLGLGAVAFGVKDIVQGGLAWQEQQSILRNSLKNTGEAGARHMNEINAAIEHSALHGGFAPKEQIEGINQLVNVTKSATSAIQLNEAATNLARGAHIEYSKALTLVARAQSGTAGRAQQYVGIIQPVKTHVDELTAAQKRLNPELLKHAEYLDKLATAQEINNVISQKYRGATSAYLHTARGALNTFRNTLDILEERIGTKLLPVIARLGQVLAAAAGWIVNHWSAIAKVIKVAFEVLIHSMGVYYIIEFIKWLAKNKDVAIALGVAIGVLATAYGGYVAVTTIASAVTDAWGAAIAFVNSGMLFTIVTIGGVVLAVGLVIAALVYAYEKVSWFHDAVNAVFTAIKNVIVTVADFVVQHWKLAVTALLLAVVPFIGIPFLIATHWKTIVHTAEDVFGAVGSFVGGIVHSIVSAVEWMVHSVEKLFHKILSPIKTVGDFFKHIGGGVVHGITHIFGLASGGAVPIGGAYLVGERGPEIVYIPGGSYVQPNSQIGGYGERAASASRRRDHGLSEGDYRRLLADLQNIFGEQEINLNVDGHKLAQVLVKNPRGRRAIAEGNTKYTLELQARS